MSKSVEEYLKHILQEIDFLLVESKHLSIVDFLQDEVKMRAYARSLEIIGEAAKLVPLEYRQKHAEIDWKGMAGMRDRLIHHYFEVDYEIVFDVVMHELPRLQEQISGILTGQ
jgi:uncharacterized protein with HEPN domain